MASSSGSGGVSSGATVASSVPAGMRNAGSSEEDLRALMDQRRAKRMLSNRESARRSRMRKQRHLDDLTAQVGSLRRENAQMATALGLTTQGYFAVEAENSVLRTQAAELAARLSSLNDILCFINTGAAAAGEQLLVLHPDPPPFDGGLDGLLLRPTAVASPEMFQYC